MIFRAVCCLLATIGSVGLTATACGQDDSAEEVSVGRIDFLKDVWPIFEAKCLQCHGPDDAKNDFRIDDGETVVDYLEAGDLEASSLWADYLITDDPDMQMPPPETPDAAPLTGVETATIKMWIEEGASWEEPKAAEADPVEEAAEPPMPSSTLARAWSFSGVFHPASVHFPVALLTVSTLFVFLSFFRPATCEPVAFHCLWIGALSAVAACAMGWAYAPHEGYGAGFSFDFQESAIDRHRWLGIVVAVIAVVLVPVARSVQRSGKSGTRLLWMAGSLLALAAVSTAGYQGGELTYGEDHYMEEFQRLFPEYSSEESQPEETTEEESSASVELKAGDSVDTDA